MAKKGKLVWAIIITLFIAAVINIGFNYLAGLTAYGLALSPLISAINLVITGFAAGLGFYLAKSLVEK